MADSPRDSGAIARVQRAAGGRGRLNIRSVRALRTHSRIDGGGKTPALVDEALQPLVDAVRNALA